MDEQIADTIIAREKEWMQAWIDKDIARVNDILSDDFLLSSARGNYMTKEQWIEGAKKLFNGVSFEWKEIKVRVYDNTAVVNAITSQIAKVGEQDWSGNFMITDVWVHQNNKWQVVARHGTGPLN